jgi:hypothetical protein
MAIEEAIFSILGDEAGHAIIADMGLHWAIVAAVAKATTADDPRAIAAIREYRAQQLPE